MKEQLPPLQGLYYFYKAAQYHSFKIAAEKLFVTPAAISQQIRLLENHLNVALFIRQHRQVTLTPQGKMLLEYASQGFEHLQQGIRMLSQDPQPGQLSISTLPSFAQHWLVPRLGDFRRQHADISMLLEPSNRLISFQDTSIDICIRYGQGSYDNLQSHYLMDEIFYPVCHPIYQQQHNIYHIEDLERAELIEDSKPDLDWNIWFQRIGLTPPAPAIRYDGSHFLLEGALAVQGVALIKHVLAHRYLKEGKLVRIGDIAMRPRYGYYLCAPQAYFQRQKIIAFKKWVEQQVADFKQNYQVDCDIIDIDAKCYNYPVTVNGKTHP